MTRRIYRIVAAVVLVGLAVLVGAPTASAHIIVDRASPNPDGSATVVFAFDHGCDLDPTVEIEITVPDGVAVTAVEPPDGWSSHEDSGAILLQGPPIPSLEYTEFSVTANIEGVPGEAIRFPTIQRCAAGTDYTWADEEGGEHPAPTLIATGAIVSAPPPVGPDGAGRTQVAIAVVAFTVIAAAIGSLVGRRSERTPVS